jgi:hypothetical protein
LIRRGHPLRTGAASGPTIQVEVVKNVPDNRELREFMLNGDNSILMDLLVVPILIISTKLVDISK